MKAKYWLLSCLDLIVAINLPYHSLYKLTNVDTCKNLEYSLVSSGQCSKPARVNPHSAQKYLQECNVEIAYVREDNRCLVIHKHEFIDTISQELCSHLTDIPMMCPNKYQVMPEHEQIADAMERIIPNWSLGGKSLGHHYPSRHGLCPPANMTTACPCCPGRGQATIISINVPYSQAQCACEKLDMRLALLDNHSAQEAGRRLKDCLGSSITYAWINGCTVERDDGLCPALIASPAAKSGLNETVWEVGRVPCGQSQTAPVVCRAPYGCLEYLCFRCQYEWVENECRGCGMRMDDGRSCYTPDVCASECEGNDGSCAGGCGHGQFVHIDQSPPRQGVRQNVYSPPSSDSSWSDESADSSGTQSWSWTDSSWDDWWSSSSFSQHYRKRPSNELDLQTLLPGKQLFHIQSTTFIGAESACAEQGGTLAVVEQNQRSPIVQALSKIGGEAWIKTLSAPGQDCTVLIGLSDATENFILRRYTSAVACMARKLPAICSKI